MYYSDGAHTEGHILAQYCPNSIFVETGTCLGRTVEFVLRHGAREVRSVEGSKDRYATCKNMFSSDLRVKLWCGHSKDTLWEMINVVDEEMVFFLDAHPSGPDSYGDKELSQGMGEFYGQHSVLTAEIDIIGKHPVKTHTIIIDDQHTTESGLAVQELYKSQILTINSKYGFKLERKYNGEKTACCLIATVSA